MYIVQARLPGPLYASMVPPGSEEALPFSVVLFVGSVKHTSPALATLLSETDPPFTVTVTLSA